MPTFKLGLIVNPYAGIGGPLGQKGSDHLAGISDATSENRAGQRALRCLRMLADSEIDLRIYGYRGVMAEDLSVEVGLPFTSVGQPQQPRRSSAEDSRCAAQSMKEAAVDLILFVGGDGTARDIWRGVGEDFPVLGLPAGVKMHSGVYAVSPESAAEIILALTRGALVEIAHREVRDIDEAATAAGEVRSRYFGELLVPAIGGFLQNVKIGGRESEELVLNDIADYLMEEMQPDVLYLVGPGSTTEALMQALGLANTLLGFDAVKDGKLLASDLSANDISTLLAAHTGPVKVIVTLIGGQGHVLGRGNQQLTPELVRRIGRDNFLLIATKTKLTALQGRPILVDSNDPELDRQWRGFIPVVTGYRDTVIYRVGVDES